MSKYSPNQRKELHNIKNREENRHLEAMLDAMRRGEDPRKIQDNLEKYALIGKQSEEIAMKALSAIDGLGVIKADEFKDRTGGCDLMVTSREDGGRIRVQVKTSEDGKKKYLKKMRGKYNEFDLEILEKKMVEHGQVIVVAGNEKMPENERIEWVQNQFKELMGMRSRS
ncbi:MAG: hypothetical protein WAV41_02245 [Microgenomates group bacterium]